MFFTIQHTSDVPIYKQICHQVKSAVIQGTLKQGQPMPSVRQLAKELHINPSTISKSYKILIETKILESRNRAGIYVSSSFNQQISNSANVSQEIYSDLSNFIQTSLAKGHNLKEIKKQFKQVIKKIEDE